MKSIVLFLALLASSWSCIPSAAAQPVPASNSLPAAPLRVKNLDPRATWFPDRDWVLFARESDDGHRSYHVLDATRNATDALLAAPIVAAFAGHGVNAPAVDLAQAMPGGLVAVRLRGSTSTWLITLDPPAVAPMPAGAASPFAATLTSKTIRSRNGGASTSIAVVNSTAEALTLEWIDAGGNARGYGTVKPGETRHQHTFGGHVWRLSRPDGVVLGSVAARDMPITTVVESLEPAASREPPASSPLPPPGPRVEFHGHNATLVRDDGSRVALTTDGTSARPYTGPVTWSPDRSRVVLMHRTIVPKRIVTLVESSPTDQVQPKTRSIEYVKPGDDIDTETPCMFDTSAGTRVPIDESLFSTPWDISRVRWRPDSASFTFVYNQRGHRVMRVVEVSSAGAVRPVVNEECQTFFDYAAKMYAEFVGTTEQLLWMSERSGWNHLYLYQRDGSNRAVTSGEWAVKRVDRIEASGSTATVWFWAVGIVPGQDPYHEHLCRVNLDGSGLVVLTAGDGTHSIPSESYSASRLYFIDRYSRVDAPPVTEVRSCVDGSLSAELTRGELTDPAQSLRLPERFVAKGRDGITDIHGIIVHPVPFDPAKQHPVIEQIYAGPHGHHVPKAYQGGYGTMDELAARGYVVVMIDGMGTNWRSKAFHDVAWKNLADAGFPDRIAWMKAAASTRPWMDLHNAGRGVGIYGGSAGGQNAMRALIDHHDFYKVAAADCGCHDNRMDKIWWNELWMSWPVGPHYEASSNVVHAGRLKGHLLLTVGELDDNVDPSSTMQVAAALIKANKDFELLVVPGAGHGAGESPFPRTKRLGFFDRYLRAN